VLLQVLLASGGTKVVNARLQPAAPGIEVAVPRVMDQLQRAINPESAPPTPTTSGGPPASGSP
jgi:hypothetical protein